MNTRIDHMQQLENYLFCECCLDNQTRGEILTLLDPIVEILYDMGLTGVEPMSVIIRNGLPSLEDD